MATRFYLPSTGAAAISPDPSASWEVTTGFDRLAAVKSKISSAMTAKQANAPGSSTNQNVLNRQYVYGPIAGGEITGTVKGQLRGLESNAGLDAVSAVLIRVITPALAVRGTLLALTYPVLSGNEYTTSSNNRYTPASASVSAVTAVDGDYIVIEIGTHCYASSTTRRVTHSFGDDHATDLGENQTDTNAFNPWVEFSATISDYSQPDLFETSVSLTANVLAGLTTEITAAASVAVSATASAALTTEIILESAQTVSVSAAADLTTDINFEAAVNTTVSAEGDLTVSAAALFEAAVSATAEATGDLETSIVMEGAASGTAGVVGDLTTEITLVGAVEATAAAAADLYIPEPVLLAGAVSITVLSSATLVQDILLAASATATVSAQAVLYTPEQVIHIEIGASGNVRGIAIV